MGDALVGASSFRAVDGPVDKMLRERRRR